jgi:hypothetical protein
MHAIAAFIAGSRWRSQRVPESLTLKRDNQN